MAFTWDSPKPFRVDVKILGECEATINYATATDALGVVKCVAMALENQETEGEFQTIVTEIKISRNELQPESATRYRSEFKPDD